MPASHRLLSTRPPWVHVLPLKPGQTAETVLDPPASLTVTTLDGRVCPTKERLLRELALLLSFPDYFDPNWDALEECLQDLEWLPFQGLLLVIEHAGHVLPEEPNERRTWLSILRATGRHWAAQRPRRSFRTILSVQGGAHTLHADWRVPIWKPR